MNNKEDWIEYVAYCDGKNPTLIEETSCSMPMSEFTNKETLGYQIFDTISVRITAFNNKG